MAGSWYSTRGGSLSARRGGRRRACICLTVSRSFRAGCAGQQLSRVIPPCGPGHRWLSHGLAGGEPRGSARRPRARARRSPGAAAPAASWRTQRIRSAAAWGWSPNSCAIRLTQPRVPSRRTARLIAAATLPAAGAADRCGAEANSASHHASSTFSRVLAVLPAGDVLAGEGTGSPGAGHRGVRSGRAARR
jgi:hypothetical protein